MKLYTSGSTDSTEWFSMFLLWTTMRHVHTCISYVQPSLCHACIMFEHVYTIMNASISFIQCSDRVYTQIYWYLYVCLCAYMFRPCIFHVHTWHVQFHFAMNKKYKQKLQRAGYEPTIVCIKASCLNHYTTSMLASNRTVTGYVHLRIVTGYVYYCFTWLGRLVTRRRTRRTPAPRAAMMWPALASTSISLKPRSVAKQALPKHSAQNSLQVRPGPGVKLTWRLVNSVVPSQTGGLAHAQAIKPDSTPLQSTIKLFKWSGWIKI